MNLLSPEGTPMSTAAETAKTPPAGNASALLLLLKLRTFIALIVVTLFFAFMAPNFVSVANAVIVSKHVAINAILAIGMTYVILTGGIDLSVGSVAGMTGIVLGLALQQFPIPVAILFAVLTGAGVGLVSGILTAYFGLAAFVVTLGVMAIARSLAYIFSGQTAISNIPEAM
jgi:ribose/xylose/arabinose/galactoside ABC-type transport system permease subunit